MYTRILYLQVSVSFFTASVDNVSRLGLGLYNFSFPTDKSHRYGNKEKKKKNEKKGED